MVQETHAEFDMQAAQHAPASVTLLISWMMGRESWRHVWFNGCGQVPSSLPKATVTTMAEALHDDDLGNVLQMMVA